MKYAILALLIPATAVARSSLYTAEKPPSKVSTPSTASAPTNSPQASRSAGRSWSMVVRGNPIVQASGVVFRELQTFRTGDLVFARVPHSVIAFGEAKAPVSARVTHSDGREFVMLGEATLEKASKRILLNFRSMRDLESDEIFDVGAQGMALDGTLGLEGEYFSGESKLFAAEILAAGAAGFADASVNRNTNVLGQVNEENSLDTKGKKALGTALSRTADRFAEKQKQSPEYSVLSGPVPLKILIIEQPRRKL